MRARGGLSGAGCCGPRSTAPGRDRHGYIDDILAAGTRILAAQDVPRIRATTDPGNVPMAAAFARAGWINFENSINMVWD
jgi:RimJ/RimL family protein N-acetyltransferase